MPGAPVGSHTAIAGLLQLIHSRPRSRWANYDQEVPYYRIALVLAVVGIMVTAFSGPVASWVSDLTDPGKSSIVASRTGRIETYQAWLFPLYFLGLATVLTGISVALWGIVRRIWIRVQALDEVLAVLKRQG